MGLAELFLLAVSLSMDAFSVSVCGSMALQPESRTKGALSFGCWFGGFQFLMPVIGYYAAQLVAEYITAYDHWIAFILGDITSDELVEALKDKKECEYVTVYSPNISNDKFTLEIESNISKLGIKSDKLRFRG